MSETISENLVVRTTVDFIRGNAKNLDLALQVEEAMPQLRADLIGEFLKSVEAELSTDEWRVQKSGANLLKGYAWLELRRMNWPTIDDPGDRTGIFLQTDRAAWADVYAGVYISEKTRNRIGEYEQRIMPAVKQAAAELPTGTGWKPHDFSQGLDQWNGWATYQYFDAPLRNWNCAQFLRNSLDADRRRKMIRHVVERIDALKPGTCALVEAAARSA